MIIHNNKNKYLYLCLRSCGLKFWPSFSPHIMQHKVSLLVILLYQPLTGTTVLELNSKHSGFGDKLYGSGRLSGYAASTLVSNGNGLLFQSSQRCLSCRNGYLAS